MLSSTYEAIRAILRADPSLSVPQRSELLTHLRNGPSREASGEPASRPPLQVLSRRKTAACLNRSLRLVDRLAEQGVLKRIKLPGRQRSLGFLASQVEALLNEGSGISIHGQAGKTEMA